jgi:hypothetical protein
MKQFITEAQRLQKLAGISELKIKPKGFKRPLKGSITPEEWKRIGEGFDIDEYYGDTYFISPQSFYFSLDPKSKKLEYEILIEDFDDEDPDNAEEIADQNVEDLKEELEAAGYNLEITNFFNRYMLYIPV